MLEIALFKLPSLYLVRMDLGSFWRNGGYDRLVAYIGRLEKSDFDRLVIETVKSANEALPSDKRAVCKPARFFFLVLRPVFNFPFRL